MRFTLKWANSLVNLITDTHFRGQSLYFSFQTQHRKERRDLKMDTLTHEFTTNRVLMSVEWPDTAGDFPLFTTMHLAPCPPQHHPSGNLLPKPNSSAPGQKGKGTISHAKTPATAPLPCPQRPAPGLLSSPTKTPPAEVYLLPTPLFSSFLGLFSPPPYLLHFSTMSYFVLLHRMYPQKHSG